MIFIIYLIGVILSFILLYFVTDSSHTLEGMDEECDIDLSNPTKVKRYVW